MFLSDGSQTRTQHQKDYTTMKGVGATLDFLRLQNSRLISRPQVANAAQVRGADQGNSNLFITLTGTEYQVWVPGVDNPDDTEVQRIVL